MTDDDPHEQRAIAQTKAGDAAAFDYLVSKYLKRVVSIVWGIVRNAHDAEDLAQEAFVRAYENIGRFRTGEPFGPWIYRIATNLSFDLMKHQTRFRHEEISNDAPAERRDDADLHAITSEMALSIAGAIDELPEMQRVVAQLHLVEGFNHAEVAAMIGSNEGTVRSHLFHARKKLQQRLSKFYGGEDE